MENIILNLIPIGIHPICHISQNDNKRMVRVNLVDGDIAYVVSNADKITLNLRKPDNSVIKKKLSITEGISYVDIEITDDMCDIEGKNICNLQIINSGVRISTEIFYMFVEKSPASDPAPSPSGPSYYPKEIIDLIPEKSTDNEKIIYSGYSEEYGGQPYYAFDGLDNISWISNNTTAAGARWIGYKFDEPVLCNMYRLHYLNGSTWFQGQCPLRYRIQGSNDEGTTWTDIYEDSLKFETKNYIPCIVERTFINENEYSWYRFLIEEAGISGQAGYGYCLVAEIELLQAVY